LETCRTPSTSRNPLRTLIPVKRNTRSLRRSKLVRG
jgi:hypothetical protein